MRRFVILMVVMVTAVLLTAVAAAQPDPTPTPPNPPFAFYTNPIAETISAEVAVPLELEQIDAAQVPQSILTEEPPSDSCGEAPSLFFTPALPGEGGSGIVLNATQAPDDPRLPCMWGDPGSPQGYRTVWYRFTAVANGEVTINTFESNYDTVLAVYRDTSPATDAEGEPLTGCADPATYFRQIACNDDAQGFTSQVLISVEAGATYYIEMADWQRGAIDPPLLRLGALWLPVDSNWTDVPVDPFPPVITRHSVAIKDAQIYIVGGQSVEGGLPVVSNRLLRLDARTGQWFEMANIPGAGLANTTAALVGDRIYVPGGFDGNTSSYNDIHWAYDITANTWIRRASLPANQLPNSAPIAFAAAAVPPAGNRYFLTGGLSVSNVGLATSGGVFAYTPATNSWTSLAPLSSERYAHTAGYIERNNRGLCVAGGLKTGTDAEGNPIFILLTRGECYLPGGEWRETEQMVVPRYGAASSVAPDGRWYVFGGFNAQGLPVATTEVYDPATNEWSALPPAYSLGGTLQKPARGWPAGGFINNSLWAIGGSILRNGEQVYPSVDNIYIPNRAMFFPTVIGAYNNFDRPDDTFAQARPILFDTPQARNFDALADLYDFYFFDIRAQTEVTLSLEVPDESNFDLYVYGQNKLLWGESTRPFLGEDEQLILNLPPRRYFIMVKRLFPTGRPNPEQVYRLTITGRR